MTLCCRRTVGWAVGAAGLLAFDWSQPTAAQPPSFTLVHPPSGAVYTQIYGLSADGSTAAGYSALAGSNAFPGFTWSAAQGRYDFGLEPGIPPVSGSDAISGDGSTVTGAARPSSSNDFRAYHWQAGAGGGPGTFQTLGTLGFQRSYGHGLSGDGSILVGHVESGDGVFVSGQAFRWTQSGGMQLLGHTRPGNMYSEAGGISRDGSTIVGYSYDTGGYGDAFRWTQSGGMQILPQLPGTPAPLSRAHDVNFNGSIIVGVSGFDSNTPVMWRDGGVFPLGPTPPGYGGASKLSVNDDGTVVVGQASGGPLTPRAVVWTPDRGMEFLSDYLTDLGVALPEGWQLRAATGVSADGLTIAGIAGLPLSPGGFEFRGFVAHVPAPGAMPLLLGFTLVLARRARRPKHTHI